MERNKLLSDIELSLIDKITDKSLYTDFIETHKHNNELNREIYDIAHTEVITHMIQLTQEIDVIISSHE